ncbi:MAG: lipocalin family protein [Agriterribacter sp.]
MHKYTTPYFKLISVFVIALSLFAISCKKDKNEDTPEPTKKELLSNSWKITNIQTAEGVSVIDANFDQIKCFKDNIFTMKTDDSFVIDEGAVVCDDSYASTGTWALIENETKIQYTPASGDVLTITIISVDKTTLKVSYPFTVGPLPGTYTITLQKI